jgi:outer membrane cobalamin receptor
MLFYHITMLRHRAVFLGVMLAGTANAPYAERSYADVRGRVVDAVTRQPIEGATVYAERGAPVTTDASGAFVLEGEVAAVTVVGGDYEPAVVELGAGEVVVALVRRTKDADGEVIEIVAKKPAETAGAVTLRREEVMRVPGARGDVLSGIKNLPGIANNGSLTPFSAGLIIRGSSPEDSRILVDGFEIPVLYHFLGVQSVLPGELIETLDYLPGAYGVKYGKASGGIVDVGSRDVPKQRSAFAEVSFVNAAALVQGPIGKRGGYIISGRRSLIDTILPAVLPSDNENLSFTAYPRYYDYQAKLVYKPMTAWKLSGLLFGSDDKVDLVTNGNEASDPIAVGRLTNATTFTRGIASAKYREGDWSATLAASGYTDTNHFNVGPSRHLLLDRDGFAARADSTWNASKRMVLAAGAEADVTRTAFDIMFTRPPREGDMRPPSFTDDEPLVTVGENTTRDLGGYVTATVLPVKQLAIDAGLRVDTFLYNEYTSVQPRGQIAYRPTSTSTLRAASGLYVRPPQHLDEGLQPDLDPERAVQSSVGAEQRLSRTLTVRTTVFYNALRDLLVLPASRQDEMSAVGYENAGRGTAMGIEVMLEHQSERTFGWISYTGSRATRRDHEGDPLRRFDYDQTHNVIAVGSWKLGKHWQFGGRFQLTTGKPYTPITGALYQADTDRYVPQFGAQNSRRVAAQHQLDLRVDRTWRFDHWKLAAYLDISNVYLNAAAIDYAYNFDYSSRTPITTLPIIPSLGIRGEL